MIVSSLNKFILDLLLYIPFSQIKHRWVPEERGVLNSFSLWYDLPFIYLIWTITYTQVDILEFAALSHLILPEAEM